MSTIQRKKGRPSRAERIQIRQDLQPYYEKRMPAYKVAQITEHDAKTVNRYYDQFDAEIYGYEMKNFVKRYEKTKMRTARIFDGLIRKSQELLEDVDNEKQEFKNKKEPIPTHLIQNYSRIIRDIAYLEEKKASMLMSPNASDMIDEEIKKRYGKHV